MASFRIVQTDPEIFRDQIAALWRKYFFVTPEARFEWLNGKNPAGAAVWLLAFVDDSEELAGMVSILPKYIQSGGKTIRCGILGDLAVDERYRVYGPGLPLLKYVTKNLEKLGFELIYTIPNTASRLPVVRAGFKPVERLIYLQKLIDVHPYLRKYLYSSLSNFLSPLIGFMLRAFSLETYSFPTGVFEHAETIDDSFEVFWQECKKQGSLASSLHSSAYLTWRYVQNPGNSFHVLSYKRKDNGKLSGYAVYAIDKNGLEIYDLKFLTPRVMEHLIKKLTQIARKQMCKSVFVTIPEKHWLRKKTRLNLFFDSGYEMSLFAAGNLSYLANGWDFWAGDRNI